MFLDPRAACNTVDRCWQTRGSIPLFWSQYPNLRYKPAPALSDRHNQTEAFQRHFDAQLFNYGKQVAINLVSCAAAALAVSRCDSAGV